MRRKSKRAKACDIPKRVKDDVWERDEHKCVICEMYGYAMPNAHFISRAHGGRGIPENVFSACHDLSPNRCHHRYDHGDEWEREEIRERLRRYFRRKYPGWNEADLIYGKYK